MKIKKKKKKFGDTIPLRIATLVLLISDCILARDKYIEKSILIPLDHSTTLNMMDRKSMLGSWWLW